jgi:hypothetical protein
MPLLPQKCTTPEGMPGTWNGTQCIPDTGTGTTLPPPPGGDTGTQPPCTMPDGTPGVTAPSGNCAPSDFQTDPSAGCKMSGGTWDEATQTCTPYTPPSNPWGGGGGTPCTQPDGSPGKVAPSGNCVPIDTVTHNPGKEGCEFGGGRWDEATQTCLERGENNCYPGEVFHPFAGCVRDTGQTITDPSVPPTPPADYQSCTAPDGSQGWVAPSGNCVSFGIDPDNPGFPGGGNYGELSPLDLPGSPLPEVPGEIGGISPVTVDPAAFNYDEVQDYIDASYNEALRRIEPQEEFEKERFAQELINKGIDPNSAAGIKELQKMQMGQTDRRLAAEWGAQQAGLAAQGQMWDQGFGEAGLANNLASIVMQLKQQGHEFDVMALLKGDEQAWKQFSDVVGWTRQDYYDWWDRVKYNDAVSFGMAGYGPTPIYNSNVSNNPFGASTGTGSQVPWWMQQ